VKTIRVVVSAENIRTANKLRGPKVRRYDPVKCSDCPIAIALTEAVGQPCEVGAGCWWRTEDGPPDERGERGWLPPGVDHWRMAYDRRAGVAPMEFEVEDYRR
jgi:hypothetical protein